MKLFFIFFLTIFLVTTPWTDTFAQTTGCDQGFQSFKTYFHPILRKNCVKCHGDPIETRPIQHSLENAEAAYRNALTLDNFVQGAKGIPTSRFVAKVAQQHWQAYDKRESGVSVETISKGLSDWYENGEKACQKSQHFVSESQKIPSLVTSEIIEKVVYSKVDFSIQPTPKALTSCVLSVEIQRYSLDAYRVRNPSVACTGKNRIKIKRLRILVNEVSEAFENAYDQVEITLDPDQPSPTLLSESYLFLTAKGYEDSLSIDLEEFTEVTP